MPQEHDAIALFQPRLIGYLCLGSAAATITFVLAAQTGVLDFNLRHVLLDLVIAGVLLVIGLASLRNPRRADPLFRTGLLLLLTLLSGLAWVDPERQMALFFIGLVIIGAFITINATFGALISLLSIATLLWLSVSLSISAEMMTYIALFYATCMLLGWIIHAFYRSFLQEIRQYEARLAQQAFTDELTRLPNRRGFLVQAEPLMASAARKGRPVSLAVIDLDHFKQLNDRYGHIAGDAALRHVADLMRAVFDENRIVLGRMGGDELMVLLPDHDLKAAQTRLQRLIDTLERQALIHNGQTLALSLSIGLAQRARGDRTLDDLIRRADMALYRAKRAGRHRIATLSGSDGRIFSAHATMADSAC